MINDDLNRNYNQIAAYSGNLTNTDRMVLYSSYEQSPTVPFVINLLVGLGIGSYVQGDSAGGAALLGFRIYECIPPFSYANNYNKLLRGALYGVPVLSVVPVMPTTNLNDMGMAVIAKVSF